MRQISIGALCPIVLFKSYSALYFGVILAVLSGIGAAAITAQAKSLLPKAKAQFFQHPLIFERNEGQAHESVKYVARGIGYDAFFMDSEVVMSFGGPNFDKESTPKTALPTAVLRLKLVRSTAPMPIEASELLSSTSNYFIGNEPSRWRTGIKHYGRVRYQEVYSGIDLEFYGNGRYLEYDLVVHPNADPSQIELTFEGAQKLSINEIGDLVIQTEHGELLHRKPYVYQETRGTLKALHVDYILSAPGGEKKDSLPTVRFKIPQYDRSTDLIIDPTLIYSSYLGGTNQEYYNNLAIDRLGNAYVVGATGSTDFPTVNPLQGWIQSVPLAAFITKFGPDGQLLYSTYFNGASGWSRAVNVATDTGLNMYVVGATSSTDFPTRNAFQPQYGGGNTDAFVTKFSPDGSIAFSTYLGGSGDDVYFVQPFSLVEKAGIVVDDGGHVYVASKTTSRNFPLRNPFQTSLRMGTINGFVTKLSPQGDALIYSTYLGDRPSTITGANSEIHALAVDAQGSVYVTGRAYGRCCFPVTPGALMTLGSLWLQGANAFVTKFTPAGDALAYSTYLAGVDQPLSEGNAIAVDRAGHIWVLGTTNDPRFRTTPDALIPVMGYPEGIYTFLSKLNPNGDPQLVYSTFWRGNIGGGGSYGQALVLGSDDSVYIAGKTNSSSFPLFRPVQDSIGSCQFNCPITGYISHFSSDGREVLFSSYLGGHQVPDRYSAQSSITGMQVDGSGSIYVAGQTNSPTFPVTWNAFQPSYLSMSIPPGGHSAFVAKIGTRTTRITRPLPNTEVAAPATVEIEAEATEQGSAITRVEFFAGAGAIGAVAGPPPYRFTWLNVPVGSYALTAKAIDDRGIETLSPPVNIAVVPLRVRINSPRDGTAILASTITVRGSVTGLVGSTVSVNGVAARVMGTTFQADNIPLNQGDNTITATAIGPGGSPTVTHSIIIRRPRVRPPTIQPMGPVDGGIFERLSPVRIWGSARAYDGARIATVSILDGETVIRQAGYSSVGAEYEFFYSSFSLGSHSLRVRATDNTGQSTTTDPISIQVLASPTIQFVEPEDNAHFVGPTNIVLRADAQVTHHAIQYVEFFNGAQSLQRILTPPYTYTWNNVPIQATPYALTARVTDTLGWSAFARVSVHVEPTVVVVNEPIADQVIYHDRVIVAGTFTGIRPTSMTVNGHPAALGTNSFAASVPLSMGPNTLTLVAVTPQGNVTRTINVRRANLSVTVNTHRSGDTVDTRSVFIAGTYQGPPNSTVIVKGRVAYVNHYEFHVANVPLDAGSNTFDVIIKTMDEVMVTQSFTLVSTAIYPIEADVHPSIGTHELLATFKAKNNSGLPLVMVEIDPTGSSGLQQVPDNELEFRVNYSTPGLYRPVIYLTVGEQWPYIRYQVRLAVRVYGVAEVDRMLQSIFGSMRNRLKAGDVSWALLTLNACQHQKYQPTFDRIAQAPNRGTRVDNLGTLVGGEVSHTFAEYLVERPDAGGPLGFLIYFIRGEDGIWRLDGM